MKTIWKYELEFPDAIVTPLMVPAGTKFVRVGMQNKTLCVWAIVETEAPKQETYLSVSATGQVALAMANYIGSATQGQFEWHVWEV